MSAVTSSRTRVLLMLVLPAVVLVVGAWFYFGASNSVDTDNAYVKAGKVMVSSQVPGFVIDVKVQENQYVQAGETLFLIDDTRVSVALDKADAELAQARTTLFALKASYREKLAQLQLAEQTQAFAEREYARQAELARQKVVSSGSFDAVANNRDATRQKTEILRQETARLLANLDGNADKPVEAYPLYMQAKAEREKAALAVSNTRIMAPFSGIVGKPPQVGQYVGVGQAVMSVVSDTNIWVEANFKETELAGLQAGQTVNVHVDAYPDREFRAHVDSISQASGAEFSVLPAQNATGNWVKVVQRIPVRIAFDDATQMRELRAGMSASVEVDTSHKNAEAKSAGAVASQRLPQSGLANAQR